MRPLSWPGPQLSRACLAVLASLLPCATAAAQHGGPPPNVLLVVADDLGTDVLSIYTPGPDAPPTPVLDALAANGVTFTRAYASPNCSPSRASFLTGRYPFRHHLGSGLQPWETFALDEAETTLPELLDAEAPQVATAAIGKWHLATENVGGGLLAPNVHGFDHYDGTLYNLYQNGSLDYYAWTRTVNGVQSPSSTYATTAQVDAALEWIDATPEPWFCYLSFSAPHTPIQLPPAHLYTTDVTGGDPQSNPRPIYNAMVEAMDTELGRLLTSMDPAVLADTVIVFIGDNGTSNAAVLPPFSPDHAKGTIYEGGVHVPLVVAGPGVAQGELAEPFVHVVDLFPTLAGLFGVDATAALSHTTLDGQDFQPWLAQPALPSARETIFSEWFYPNSDGTPLGQELCQLNIGFGGPGIALRLCGDRLYEGGSAQLMLSGAQPGSPYFLALALSAEIVPFADGALVPELPFLLFLQLTTDGLGKSTLPVAGGLDPFGVPYTMYFQAVAPKPGGGWDLSNGVGAAFEDQPKSQRMLRDDRYKYIKRIEFVDGLKLQSEEFFDLLTDPFEQVDLLEASGPGGLLPEELAAYQKLKQELVALIGS